MARRMPRQPDRERFEVRRVLADEWGRERRREPLGWHRKRERAIAAAEKLDGDIQVVWTHSDDEYLGDWLDDAMVVWSNRREDADD